MKKPYPLKCCYECGASANVIACLKKYKKRPNKISFSISTYHKSRCDVCGEMKMVTEPRDFFYPDFTLLSRNFNIRYEQK